MNDGNCWRDIARFLFLLVCFSMLLPAARMNGQSREVHLNSISSEALRLEIVGMSNGIAAFHLHNATNGVYEVLSKTNLALPDWHIEQALWPGTNRDVQPFTIPVR